MESCICLNCMGVTDAEVCPHCGCAHTVQNEPHQLPPGAILRGQYMIGRALGQGGFGITYLARDLFLDRVVAIKEFYPNTLVNRSSAADLCVNVNTVGMEAHYGASRERFLREAKALAKLTDVPEIVGIHSCFQENNTAYIAMEYVRGVDLATYVQRRGGKLGVEETLRILEPVIRALGTVHKAGLVHRDISPDNIMLHPTGGAKLLDFGAVRAIENVDVGRDLARSTEAILKPGFAPMEQYRTRGNVGPWSDEYALCGTVYYCLTGRVPPDAVTRSIGEEEPDWNVIPDLAEHQKAALRKGMSFLAKDRYASMEELYAALTSVAAPVPVPGPVVQAVSTPRREEHPTPVFKGPDPWQPTPPMPGGRVKRDTHYDVPVLVLHILTALLALALIHFLSGLSQWRNLILRIGLAPILISFVTGFLAFIKGNRMLDLISVGSMIAAILLDLIVVLLWGTGIIPGVMLAVYLLLVVFCTVYTVRKYR